MSHDVSTSLRVYEDLRTAVLAGSFTDPARLDFAELAIAFGVSTTPVREAAMRLLGEGLLELHPKGGARPLRLSEFALRSLLDVHATIILGSLGKPGAPARLESAWRTATDNEQRSRTIFGELASWAGNPELGVIVTRLSDRLAPYRLREDRVLGDSQRELGALRAAYGDPGMLRRLIRAYHRRRMAKAASLVWVAMSAGE